MSYNPTKKQRAFDKLASAWSYINWFGDFTIRTSEAMRIISDLKQNFIDGSFDIEKSIKRCEKWRNLYYENKYNSSPKNSAKKES